MLVLICGLLVVSSCSTTSPSAATGLSGVVVRGPVTPVCRIDVPCDAPFSAMFSVQRSGRQVAEFRSDASGVFTVFLQPGDYTIIPAPDAPIILPAMQRKQVSVADSGTLTTVRLTFDTGIR